MEVLWTQQNNKLKPSHSVLKEKERSLYFFLGHNNSCHLKDLSATNMSVLFQVFVTEIRRKQTWSDDYLTFICSNSSYGHISEQNLSLVLGTKQTSCQGVECHFERSPSSIFKKCSCFTFHHLWTSTRASWHGPSGCQAYSTVVGAQSENGWDLRRVSCVLTNERL